MSLDTLLKRLIETPETPRISPDVSPVPAWIKAETPETPETCEKTISDDSNLILEQQRETRRQKVLTMLEAAPEKQRAIYADTDSDNVNVILTVAVRHVATCELLIPKAKYDPWRLLALVDSAGGLH